VRRGLVIAGVVVLAATVIAFVIAAQEETTDPEGAWFAGIAAGLTLLALLAGGAAIYFALPDYWTLLDTQRAKPEPTLLFQFREAPDSNHWIDANADTPKSINASTFEARLLVRNLGDAVLRWGILNIHVPVECTIKPVVSAGATSNHRPAASEFTCDQLYPGKAVPSRATVAERDYPPVHTFLYVVEITVPEPGEWPIAAILDGYPAVTATGRALVHFGGEP
jgi:hypothetical protein